MRDSLTSEIKEARNNTNLKDLILGGKDPEADTPVPDRLLPKWKTRQLLSRLRLGQKVGLLLFLNRKDLLSKGGQDRLLYLQSRASFEAIEAGLKFCQRLLEVEKLQSDFKHQMIELNRRPQTKRYRRYQANRIGVGYRDKGALPEESNSPRNLAQKEGVIFLADLSPDIRELVLALFPNSVVEEWLDLDNLYEVVHSLEDFQDLDKLLNLL
jgi:hypothetical protein